MRAIPLMLALGLVAGFSGAAAAGESPWTVKVGASQVKPKSDPGLGLADNLKRVVFGQDEAIDTLVTAIKLSRAGLTSPDKPIGSFVFAGPTGVGKTEISKQLANVLSMKPIV